MSVYEEYPPLRYYSISEREAKKWLELVKEDHSYTFKTIEQRHQRDKEGRIYDPHPNLPYGPKL